MEIDHRGRPAETRSTSVLQADETFYNRVISRDSTSSSSAAARCPSSRVFYYRSAAEGVPFNWETQPGTPKNPPKEEAIPPISPPPAVLSLSLPKPSIINDHVNANAGGRRGGYSNARRLKLLWRFLVGKGSARRRRLYGHHQSTTTQGRRSLENVNNKNTRRSWDDQAGDSIASPRDSSFSSSAISRSSSNDDGYSRLSSNSDASSGSPRSRRETVNSNNNDYGRGCGGGRTWNINSMLVCVSGKI
ncbi:unnamed protein product [Linum trigynum]|uniref:Uncharacterized protein n=1 Tax=Linum trigynum TaxID=586398 RepID=A0AAV2CPZ1_9ROSI